MPGYEAGVQKGAPERYSSSVQGCAGLGSADPESAWRVPIDPWSAHTHTESQAKSSEMLEEATAESAWHGNNLESSAWS